MRAGGARLHVAAIEKYIDELERDKAALIEALKDVAEVGELCGICSNRPKNIICEEVDFECSNCGLQLCRCRGCGAASEHFAWEGRE